jgi:hypothetical protein
MRLVNHRTFVLLAAAIPAAACGNGGASSEPASSVRQADPVADFVEFSRTPADAAAGSGVDYVAVGLRTLAGALASRDLHGMDLPLDLRVGSAHVALQPTSLEVAELMRSLAIRTATVLATAGETHDVRARADAISADRPVVEQIPVIRAFFEAAAGALAPDG